MLAEARHDRLRRWLDAATGGWLVVLPALRPLVWSGEPADTANAGYACLLAAAIATALLRRALGGNAVALGRVGWVGVVFLAIAALGAWRSPFPFQAWTTWYGWALHLGAAVALADAIRARPGLLVAGLLGGLAAECATLAAQVRWERPALIAQLALDPAAVDQERLRAHYDVRASSWRLEGTFLLANTLAAYLITVLPLVAGLTWSAWRQRAPGRFALGALTVLAALALARSGSKMGILALALAITVVAAASLRGRRRVLSVAGLVAVIGVALVVPALRARVVASADVRLDYWRAGVAMVAEKPLFGHGLDGFRQQYPRLKPPGGEETVIAHNEPLQAAVDLGLPAGVLVLAWWLLAVSGVWRARREIVLAESGRSRATAAVIAGVLMAYVFLATGVLDGQTLGPWWQAMYGAGLIAVAMAVVWAIPMPPLPAWAAVSGLLACLIHALADFHLHSPQVVGPLALVAVLAGGGVPSPRRKSGSWAALALILLVGALGISVAAGARDDLRQRATQAETVLRRLVLEHRQARDDGYRAETVVGLQQALGAFDATLASLGPEPEQVLADAAVAEIAAASQRWPADPLLAGRAVSIANLAATLSPSAAQRFTPLVDGFQKRWPDHLLFVHAAAVHHRRLATLPDAGVEPDLVQALLVQAIRLYPTHLPLRRQLIAIARARGDETSAQEQEAEVARLLPLVHPANR